MLTNMFVSNLSRQLNGLMNISKTHFTRRFYIRNSRMLDLITYSDEVLEAKINSVPIVALESTIITHGMPFPQNFQTAMKVENIVRQYGVVPATIAILEGQIHVGLSKEQLMTLANAKKPVKCSRRDLPVIVAQKLNGGTTVSATMLIAKEVDIPVMATGGIGGVHRDAEISFDISADLTELGKTPVAIVCSGVKSILDVGKTVEYLETQGVPIIKIGNNNLFPGFYCIETPDGLRAPHYVSSSKDAADVLRSHKNLGLSTGVLFAVPIPQDDALLPEQVENIINMAVQDAKSMGVKGKQVTPYILEKLNKSTSVNFLQANIALIKNNAKVAAEIASHFNRSTVEYSIPKKAEERKVPKNNLVVIGGAILDVILQVEDASMKLDGKTYFGRSRHTCGGVARNVADALIKLGASDVRLITVVGKDLAGETLIKSVSGAEETIEQVVGTNSAKCTVFLNCKGECGLIVAEVDALKRIDVDLLNKHRAQLHDARMIIIDANLSIECMKFVVDIACHGGVPVWYEPTDFCLATKLFKSTSQWKDTLHFISPNRMELLSIAKFFNIPIVKDDNCLQLEDIKDIMEKLSEYIPVIITTLGIDGVAVTRRGKKTEPFYDENGELIQSSNVSTHFYPPLLLVPKDKQKIISVSGCGDCLAAAIIYGIQRNFSEEKCITLALNAAALSLESFDSVPSSLSNLSSFSDTYSSLVLEKKSRNTFF